MLKVDFTVEGVSKLKSNLNIYDMETKRAAQKIIRSTTSKVAREARQTVPTSPLDRVKSSGSPEDLKKSITTKYYHNDLVSTIYPKVPKGAHRSIITKGTVVRRNRKGANRGRVSPQPFMLPAKNNHIGTYNAKMKQLWEKEVEV